MSNKRQIPFLHWRKLSDGRTVGEWKPSPRLRKLGWTNRVLGYAENQADVMRAAIALNAELAAWEAKRNGAAPSADAAPRRRTFGDLVTSYKSSNEWSKLGDNTQREYNVRLRFLESWAMDGRLPLAELDKQLVRDLKDALASPAKDGTPASPYKLASTLRVLRLLLNWAKDVKDWIAVNPVDAIKVPTPPSRTASLQAEQCDAASAAAIELGYPSIALAIDLGLWAIQREGDMLALTRMSWRRIDNIEPNDRAILANREGHVMGFRLIQQKTKVAVTAPIPPAFHDRVNDAFSRSQHLIIDDLGTAATSGAIPPHLFRRRLREAFNRAGLNAYQYRDIRRSGMIRYNLLGAPLPSITSISGHKVMGKRTILDVYMPGNERAACDAVAKALRTLAAQRSAADTAG